MTDSIREKVKISKEEIRKAITSNYIDFKAKLFNELKKALESKHRLLVILSGDDHRKLAILNADILISFIRFWFRNRKDRNELNILYVFHDEFDDAILRERIVKRLVKRYVKRRRLPVKTEYAVYESSERYLGTTYQVLVMDLINSLKPNDIGRLVGIVEGGGIVILQVPKWSEWHERKNLFQMTLTVPQYPEPRKIFVRWFKEITLDCDGIFIYDVDNDKPLKTGVIQKRKYQREELKLPEETIFSIELYKLALTQDQINSMKLLEHIIEKPKKPKKRIAVILIADRGRGKSCTIGISLAGIILELLKVKNRVRIGVTAPSITNVQPLMNIAMKALDKVGLSYRVIERMEI